MHISINFLILEKQQKRYRRHKRIRAKISGTAKVPRLSVFRSSRHIYAQLIDDEKGMTLVSASDIEFKKLKTEPPAKFWWGAKVKKSAKKDISSFVSSSTRRTKFSLPIKIKKAKIEETQKLLSDQLGIAYEVGKLIAKKAKDLKVEKVVFDRSGYKYQGKVKALAEGARKEGLQF